MWSRQDVLHTDFLVLVLMVLLRWNCCLPCSLSLTRCIPFPLSLEHHNHAIYHQQSRFHLSLLINKRFSFSKYAFICQHSFPFGNVTLIHQFAFSVGLDMSCLPLPWTVLNCQDLLTLLVKTSSLPQISSPSSFVDMSWSAITVFYHTSRTGIDLLVILGE